MHPTGAERVGAEPFGTLPERCDAVIVGAGFAGIYMVHKLRRLGFHAHVIEAGGGVGGTWYWNRYPGARCDVDSIQYSYSFDEALQQEWVWTERYASQSEILAYAEHVVERFRLAPVITLNTRVTGADLDESTGTWTVHTDAGASVQARYLIAAVGCLSTAQIPDWPGLAEFAGETYHPGAWPHEGVDLRGKRVGVIGTGSSGIQLTPTIARYAAHLTVFQRTATYSIPARNRPLPPEELAELKRRYPEIRLAARRASNGRWYHTENRPLLGDSPDHVDEVLWRYWEFGGQDIARAYNDTSIDPAANAVVSDFIRARIADVVADPLTREILTPRTYPFNTRRPCLDTDYFETFNLPHVDLVDVRADPIVELTRTGIRTEGAEYDLDVIVFATGYDAMTGTLIRLNVRGRDGQTLDQTWERGPQTYLGLSVSGFPNFFILAGPGSPSVLSNVIVSIEQHVEWLADLLVHVRGIGATSIEAELPAQDDWVRGNIETYEKTMLNGVESWYVGANIPGKPRVILPFIGGVNVYRQICDEIAASGYPGLRIGAAEACPVGSAAASSSRREMPSL